MVSHGQKRFATSWVSSAVASRHRHINSAGCIYLTIINATAKQNNDLPAFRSTFNFVLLSVSIASFNREAAPAQGYRQ
jgi:hypothetical protein